MDPSCKPLHSYGQCIGNMVIYRKCGEMYGKYIGILWEMGNISEIYGDLWEVASGKSLHSELERS